MRLNGGQVSRQFDAIGGWAVLATDAVQAMRFAWGDDKSSVWARSWRFRKSCLHSRRLTLGRNAFGVALFGLLLFGSPPVLTAQTVQYDYDTMKRLTHVAYEDGTAVE